MKSDRNRRRGQRAWICLALGLACFACRSDKTRGGKNEAGAGGESERADGGAARAGRGGKSGSAGGPAAAPDASVLERNNHPSRNGLFVQPTLTKSVADKLLFDSEFKATFAGNVWASPLYFEKGPDGKGVFFSVTTANDVYALDETSGEVVWTTNIGPSPTANGPEARCGSIHPLGIISTPVIDAASRTLFVAGAIGASSIERHEVHALSIDDGKSRDGWPFNVNTVKSGDLQFKPQPHNQRSALSLVDGTLYVAYGGHVGDCGDYRGWVVGIDIKDPARAGGWASRGRGEGIWAAGGLASDGKSVFAITGNNTAGATSRDLTDGEAVVRVSGLGVFERDTKNYYVPDSWRQMDRADADFGASSPVYITLPGENAASYVVAIAKDGHFYLLDPANLGGLAGHVVDYPIADGSMSVRTVPAAYPTSDGVNVVFSTGRGGRCPAGGPTGHVVMAVKVTAGSPPQANVAWCAALSGPDTGPIVTTTDGEHEPIVWFMSAGKLNAVDGETGALLWDGGEATCNGVRQWTSPIAVKGRIIVGGDGNLCSWSVRK